LSEYFTAESGGLQDTAVFLFSLLRLLKHFRQLRRIVSSVKYQFKPTTIPTASCTLERIIASTLPTNPVNRSADTERI
jgi:hypothetical protein